MFSINTPSKNATTWNEAPLRPARRSTWRPSWILVCVWFVNIFEYVCFRRKHLSTSANPSKPQETSSTLVYDPKLPQPSRKELTSEENSWGDFMHSLPRLPGTKPFSSKWLLIELWIISDVQWCVVIFPDPKWGYCWSNPMIDSSWWVQKILDQSIIIMHHPSS